MDIALAKRRENIAEYILYLWQIEDLLRALQFSPEAIYSQLIAPRGIEEGQRHNYLLWYMDIANSNRDFIYAISKKNCKIFKKFIERDDAIYTHGREKYEELAFQYWCFNLY